MERTEEQIMTKEPLIVSLGGREYKLPPLTVIEARVFRAELLKVIRKMPKQGRDQDDEIVNVLFTSMPDSAADLFFLYAKGLNREEIEKEATEDELALALEKVLEFARPLALIVSLNRAIPKTIR